jgi:hypothetical protein
MAAALVHKRVAVVDPIDFAVGKVVGVVVVHMEAEPVADSIAQGALDLVVETEGKRIEAVDQVGEEEVCCSPTVLVGKVRMCHMG